MVIKMDRSAVLHIPMSEYAYGIDEEHVTIRLRCARGDLRQCILYFGDRACRQTPVIFTRQEMKVAASDEYFDYYEVTLEHPYKRINYYFELIGEKERVLYYGDCFMETCVDDRSEYYQLPFNHRADIVTPPAWAQDTVIYHIFPDSFATGKEYLSGKSKEAEFHKESVKGKLGGTIRGISENVGYLKELGFNGIYINPIFAAGEYHKYDLLDYYHVDPCFGTNEEFKELVKIYHENGMRVIIDGVFNHCGWKFFAFEDVVKKGENSRYKDWFYHLEFPVVRPQNGEIYPDYECFGYERMMPKLNTQNPEVIEYFCRVCQYWLKEYEIDGWRLDVASEINDAFWESFYRTAKEINPEAILIGEVWETARHWLDGKKFDSTMNYDFRKHCRRFFAEKSIDAYEFDGRVTNMRMRYRTQTVYAQLNLLDSHDVSRFLSLCGGDEKRYQLAVLFQMTFPGIPSVFYGDEKGIDGILEEEYRAPMPWEKEEDALLAFYKKAIGLRREYAALRQGGYRTIQAQKGSRLYIYARETDSDTIMIALNGNDTTCSLPELFTTEEIIWQEGLEGGKLASMGWAVVHVGT
ncbi:MAG: alpha amylase N-terminal ig-like domain-containing protein [Blautia sp.]|nr:alpha amylase N-terminal ig-like domain-containing protein [Lachnoclostridium sp.]MCM1210484.1 alpha amylase N-terminal ig-like domain-containing protein [Blautia sp.]